MADDRGRVLGVVLAIVCLALPVGTWTRMGKSLRLGNKAGGPLGGYRHVSRHVPRYVSRHVPRGWMGDFRRSSRFGSRGMRSSVGACEEEARRKGEEAYGVTEATLSRILTNIVHNTPDIKFTRVLPYERFISDFLGSETHEQLTHSQREGLRGVVSKLLRKYDIDLDCTTETQARVLRLETDEKKAARELRNLRDKFYVKFTCNKCQGAGIHRASFDGWNKGSVVITCHFCGQMHIVADPLGSMDFEGFKNIADPETQKRYNMNTTVRMIGDSSLLSEDQLKGFGVYRNKTTGALHTFDELNKDKKKNIGFGLWDDESLRPSNRKSALTKDWIFQDAQAYLTNGTVKYSRDAMILAEERQKSRENPWDYARALVFHGKVSNMEEAWTKTEEVFAESEGGIRYLLSTEDQQMLRTYQQYRTIKAAEEATARAKQPADNQE